MRSTSTVEKPARPQRLDVFRTAAGWSWRFRASNGPELGRSSQVYTRRIDALHAAASEHGIHPDAMTDGMVLDRPTGEQLKIVIKDERVQS